MDYTYGTRPADVLTDGHGNPRSGVDVGVYTAAEGGEPVADVTPLDGAEPAEGTVTTNRRGRWGFQSDTGPVVWADDGVRDRWPVMALEAATEAVDLIDTVRTHYHRALADAEQAEADARAAQLARDAPGTARQAVQNIGVTAEQTVRLDDLYTTTYLPCWNYNTHLYEQLDGVNAELGIFTAPFPLVVHRVSMSYEYTEVTASATNYWTFLVNRVYGPVSRELARSTTQPTGPDAGGGVQPRVPRHIEVPGNNLFAAGQVLTLRMEVSGTPDPLWFSAQITVRYTPA